MPKLNINFKGLFHRDTVYKITEKGLDLCPEEKTYGEGLSDYDGMLYGVLRFIKTGTRGTRSEAEIFNHFHQYEDVRVRNALTTAEYMGLTDVKKQWTR
jgi:hypothetical protein